MGEQNLNIRIKHKYDTEANWNKNNPVLLSGEIAITSDKFGKHKVGDGTHKWSELSYVKADLTKSDVIYLDVRNQTGCIGKHRHLEIVRSGVETGDAVTAHRVAGC